MKKFFALMLCLVMVLGLVACGAKADGGNGGASANVDVASPEELLSNVFALYAEDEKFPVGGGDAENMVMDAPGAMNVADAETIDYMVGLPAGSIDKVDAVASALHMMNANTFTAGCYHVADSANTEAVIKALQENIQARQWMCGIPEGLVICTVGDYVVSAFGAQQLLDTFTGHLNAAYEGAVTTVVSEPIA